jgi:LuxR family maltose regulon positive regulatory protein
MPKPSLHTLTWSEEHQHYKLHTHGRPQQSFRRGDEQPWQYWLTKQRSFSFQGQHGHLSVIKEIRPRGTGYWYAYNTLDRQIRKRYLGPTTRVTLQRLEEEAQALATESIPTSHKKHRTVQAFPGLPHTSSQNNIPLLATKHTPPRLPATLVRRERLLQDLDAVLDHRLLLFSAPAGSGKTTILSARAAQSPHTIAWLSLDELDNDATRFWASVIAALRLSDTCLSEIGSLALAMLYAPQPQPLSTVLTTLINEVLGYSDEIILILDDYHVIEDQTIHDAMLFLLDHLPANLHLILSSRVDPEFPLARWRMRGQMAEVRETDVRFTKEEADSFLRQEMDLSISLEDVQLLADRTEGWIAGLQLAALSIRSQQNPSAFLQHFTGCQRFILDYVQEEILQHQPLPVQRFLLQISVLSRMNAALCQVLTDDPASQELLEALEHNNLFVVPLDEQRQWYRLHTLFREVLLARLQATQPNLVPSLHQRAAHWYAEQGYVHEAITNALTAQDYSFAASVMERAARQLWLQGEAKTVSTWLLQLPDTILQAHLDFALTSALNLLSSTQYMPEQQRTAAQTQSERLIARVEQALQSTEELSPSEEQRLHNRIHLLHGLVRMSAAFRAGNMLQVRHIAQQMQPLAKDEHVAWKWFPLYGLFVSAQMLGDSVLLLPELLAIKQQALQEQDHTTAIVVMCWIAGAFLYAGQLHSLQQECLQVQHLLEQSGDQVAVAAYPAFDLSFLYYAWNQLEKAEACLQTTIQHAYHWQDMNLLVWSYSASVKVLLASGKMVEAEQALQEVQNLIQQTGFTVYEPDVMAAQVSLWLAQGNLSAASVWANQYIFNSEALEYIREEEYLALARVYLAQQQYEQCLQLLARLISRMEQVERQWDIIHFLALQVVALHNSGQISQAQQVTVRLLTMTESEDHIRIYLDAGQPMRQVLKTLLNAPHDAETSRPVVPISYVSTLLETFEQEERKHTSRASTPVSRATETLPSPPQSPSSAQPGLYEPLSPQEQRVLRLLVAGRTYAEIAQELIVSLNTIKTQVSSIYRKLGVSRRAEATAVSQRLHLL